MIYQEQYDQYLLKAETMLSHTVDCFFRTDSDVSNAARYSLFAGGKRVRAVLCLAVCEMLSGDSDTAAWYAAGVEMLHCYSLIHDDLPCMDNDDMRRGKPSCHKAYGEATALLAGDALLTAAFEVLSSAPGSAQQNAQAVLALSHGAGANGMVWGQELDLHFEKKEASATQLEEIHKNKTGALIHAAAQLGAISANATKDTCACIGTYAYDLGLAFQVVDDILDVTSSAQMLGKPIGSDEKSGKTTFVSLYGLEKARTYAATLTQRAAQTLKVPYGEKAEFLMQLAQNMLTRCK